MSKPNRRPASVKAWAFSVRMKNERDLVQLSNGDRESMDNLIAYWHGMNASVGPVVRIEVPAPRARKGKA